MRKSVSLRFFNIARIIVVLMSVVADNSASRLERVALLEQTGLPSGWDGTWNLGEKQPRLAARECLGRGAVYWSPTTIVRDAAKRFVATRRPPPPHASPEFRHTA
jgi:hypothetical protein